jgi:hypothetical protein
MTVRIRYGVDYVDKQYTFPPRVSDIRSDPNLRAELGYGDNIKLSQNGVELPADATISMGSEVCIETIANSKAQPFCFTVGEMWPAGA